MIILINNNETETEKLEKIGFKEEFSSFQKDCSVYAAKTLKSRDLPC